MSENFEINKRILILITLLVALIFTGSIIATYFGKKCPKKKCDIDANNLFDKCQSQVCSNGSLIESWIIKCPATTSQSPQTTSITTGTQTTTGNQTTTGTQTTTGNQTTTGTQTTTEPLNFRLPDNLKPISYDLTMKPYIGTSSDWSNDKAFTFDGYMIIDFICIRPTQKIVLHSLNLNIQLLELKSNTDNDTQVSSQVDYERARQFATMSFNRDCVQNAQYKLKLNYTGPITQDLVGFYRSSFTDQNGVQQYLATTQFEAIYARRAFPCFDEPAMKATFKYTLIRHESFSASFFNTPLIRTDKNGPWFTDYYEETVKMSTYLVAFAIASFKQIEKTSEKGVLIQVAAKPQSIDAGEAIFALNEASLVMDFFIDHFEIAYPMKKSTQIAIPDFSAGAMENWGLIMYRETDLLFNPNRDLITNKRRVSLVISHELAHQWFGNLVTLPWWGDIWLNEGFASWYEYLGLNKAHPEWRDLEYFFVQRLSAMVTDSLETSVPIRQDINDPNESNSWPSAITYSKGASVIRMMNAFLTEKTFTKGIKNFLLKYSYDNPVQDNLWEELTAQAHLDGVLNETITIKPIMDTWTVQKGYPVVTVTRLNSNQISLTQKWFLLNPLNSVQDTDVYRTYRWYVPFTFTTKEELNFEFETKPTWFSPDLQELIINLPTNTDQNSWIIGNLQHAGFYRVNYDTNNWNRLIEQLNTDHRVFNPINRAQLVDDSFSLGRAEIIDQVEFLKVAKYLAAEQDPMPFVAAFSSLNTIATFLEDKFDTFDLFKTFYKNLLTNTYNRLGWRTDIEDANEINLQTSTLQVMCSYANPDCVEKSKAFFNDLIIDNKPLPLNFKTIIYSTIAMHGDQKDWLKLYELAMSGNDYPERIRIFRGLATTQNFNLLKSLLEKLADSNVVRLQDKSSLLSNIAANPVGRSLAYEYMEKNWQTFVLDYGSTSSTLSSIATSCTNRLNSEYELGRVENFIKTTPNLGPALRSLNAAIENIKTNIRWNDKNTKPLADWLADNLNIVTPQINYRIPDDLSPYHYDIQVKAYFRPTLRPEYFDGVVKIKFTCVKNTSKLMLHAKDLDINNASLKLISLTDSTFTLMTNFKWTYDSTTHIITVNLGNQIFKQGADYEFSAEYRGYHKDDNLGFYRTSYLDANNNRRWVILSQLEYIEARRSFISFDEPGFRSVFKVTIIHDSSVHAMSNMPIKSSNNTLPSDGYDWVRTEFDESPKMSTYLLAISVSDYECIEGVSDTPLSQGVKSKICARPNAKDQLGLAFNASLSSLAFFEGFYQVKYPLPKLDHVATPTFKYGAMENWGMAIYIETAFLFNSNSPPATEQNIVRLIAHEISHMWFGNLVTPKWWNDLWLNEGFATYAEHLGTDGIRPSWRMFDRLYDLILGTIQADSNDKTRPVSSDVNTPEEIDENFNPTITYRKGSTIVKMLEYVLGYQTFKDGLKSYFEKFAYKNVDQFDLWNTLHEQAISEDKLKNLNLSKVMTEWAKQKGHPVVHVKIVNSMQISIKQNRFVLDAFLNANLQQFNDIKWSIPFSYSIETIGSNSSFTNLVNPSNLWNRIIWLSSDKDEKLITLGSPLGKDDFLVVNLDMAGFYRVNYDQQNWKQIIKQLSTKPDQLSARTRAQVISDVFSLSEANYISSELALDLSKYLTTEFDFLPWNAFISRIKFFTDLFDSTPSYGKMRDYLASLIKPYYLKLGWIDDPVNDSWTDRLYRTSYVRFACQKSLPECVQKAREYFDDWKATGDLNKFPTGYRAIISCAVVSSGTEADFEYILTEAKKLTDESAKNDLLSGLSCATKRWLLSKYLEDQLASSTNILTALTNVVSRTFGSSIAWDFLKAYWNQIYSAYSSSTTFPTLITELSLTFKNQEQYDSFLSFFANKQLTKAINTAVDNAKDKIRSNVKWFNDNNQKVANWLDTLKLS